MSPPIRRFNALLVEGVPGIGKSTVIDALVRRHLALVAPGTIRTLLHLCQAYTMGPLARAEDGGTLTLERNREHLDRIARLLESFQRPLNAMAAHELEALGKQFTDTA